MPAVNRATKQLTSCVWFRTTSVWIVANLKGCALFKVCHQHEKTALFKERGSVAVTFRKWKLEKGTPRQVTRQWALNAVLFTIFFSPTFLQPFDNNLTSRPHNTKFRTGPSKLLGRHRAPAPSVVLYYYYGGGGWRFDITGLLAPRLTAG